MVDIKKVKEFSSSLRVLYVEDEEQLREKTSEIFKNLFESIETAANGKEGLEKYNDYYEINGEFYDLVITDVNMPMMNGIELSKNLLKTNKEQHIMVISAYNDPEMLESFIEIGINGFVKKPMTIPQFLTTLYKIAKTIVLNKESIKNREKIEKLNHELQTLNRNLEKKVDERTKQIKDQLLIDSLTSLKSYAALIEDQKGVEFHALYFIDIDNFSQINSIYGYLYGNNILKQFSKCLNSFNSINEYKYKLYRISSDKFAVYQNDRLDNIFDYEKHLFNLKNYIENYQFFIEDIEFNLSTTIGLSLGQENPIVTADMALSHAKKSKLGFQVYNSDIDILKQVSNNLEIRNKIKYAIHNDGVYPVYQPIVNKEGEVIKYEVLMRVLDIKSKEERILYPDEFLTVAIQSKQYNQLCNILFEKTFEYMNKTDKDFSINLSYEDIYNKTLVKYLKKNLDKHPGIGNRFIVEILETLAIEETKVMNRFLEFLNEYNVKVAVDDFGTGYSNFSHIIDLRPDYVKIDGKFIRNILKSRRSQIIVKSIIYFAKKLDIKVIAEYVHSKEVFEWVRDAGVDEFQGYYFSKPLILK